MAKELKEIRHLVAELNNKMLLDDSMSYVSHSDLKDLSKEFHKLIGTVYNHKSVSQKTFDRFDELTDIMTQIANLDFSGEAPVSNKDTHLDYIATGLNLINYHLKDHFQHLKLIEDVVNQFTDHLLITGEDDRIVFANKSFLDLSEYTMRELRCKAIQTVLDLSSDPIHLLAKNKRQVPVSIQSNGVVKTDSLTYQVHKVVKVDVNKGKRKHWSVDLAVEKAMLRFKKELAEIRKREELRSKDKLRFLTQMKSSLEDQERDTLSFIELAWLMELERILK